MKSHKRMMLFYLLAGLLSLSCFAYTRHDIHVTLDIRHIQETASSFEDYVSGKKEAPPSDAAKGAFLMPEPQRRGGLSIFSSAWADEQSDNEFGVKDWTPLMRKIADSRKARFDDIKKLKKEGKIGENNKAMLEIPPKAKPEDLKPDSPQAQEWKKIEDLVKQENDDREKLYKEVAKQYKTTRPEDLEKIALGWAREFRARAESGEWIQAPQDPKEFERFVQSGVGKKFTEKPKPGEWVKVP
ncbi:MAG: hypothetical protein Kow0059_16920 [Candidatus Sumerlaeia bacterium]